MLNTALFSCKKEEINGDISYNTELAAELTSSSQIIAVAEHQFILETNLWRDFMPGAEANGSPLICVSYLKDQDSTVISSELILKKQYIINGGDIWISDYSETENHKGFAVKGIVRNGPKWGPNLAVHVVSEFEFQNETYRILAKYQKIRATF